MKLIRYGDCGDERPGLIDDTGTLRDLGSVIKDWDYQTQIGRAHV